MLKNNKCRKKILFISTQPVYDGVDHAGGVTILLLIKYLAKKHDVSLLCMTKEKGLVNKIKKMSAYCKEVDVFVRPKGLWANIVNTVRICAMLLFIPPDISSYYYHGMKKLIKRHVNKCEYDIIQYEYTAASVYAPKANKGEHVSIIDAHDVVFVQLQRMIRRENNILLKISLMFRCWAMSSYELTLSSRFDYVLVRSENDKKALGDKSNIQMLKYGIDIKRINQTERRANNNIVFMGKMDRYENIIAVKYFISDIYPLIMKKYEAIKFYVVGASPPDDILAMQSDNIIVTGWVDDLDIYMNKCIAFVSPIVIGGGVIAKNLEAMARGLAVITTPPGNYGIEAKHGVEILVADNANSFAKYVVDIVSDPSEAKRLGENARKYVIENNDIDRIMQSMSEIYEVAT